MGKLCQFLELHYLEPEPMNLVKDVLITLVIFTGIDFIWLGVIAKGMIQKEMGHLLREKFMLAPALLFYVLYSFGLLYLAIYPAIKTGDIKKVVISSLLLGLVSYATYELTNLAVLNQWSLKMTVVDIIWGTILSGITGFLVFKLIS